MPKRIQWFFDTLNGFEEISIVLCFAAAVIKQYKLDRFLFFFFQVQQILVNQQH